MQFSSDLLESAVNEFAKLPGIGKKTALRLVLHLLKTGPFHGAGVWRDPDPDATGDQVLSALLQCSRCRYLFHLRKFPPKQEMICVVESIREVIAIESTQQYNGTYHVLGRDHFPSDGGGARPLNIEALVGRVQKEHTQELIFALNLRSRAILPSIISRNAFRATEPVLPPSPGALPFGGELEYADEMTLARSITNRLPIESYMAGR